MNNLGKFPVEIKEVIVQAKHEKTTLNKFNMQGCQSMRYSGTGPSTCLALAVQVIFKTNAKLSHG